MKYHHLTKQFIIFNAKFRGDMEELKNWLIGKMLWDPTLVL